MQPQYFICGILFCDFWENKIRYFLLALSRLTKLEDSGHRLFKKPETGPIVPRP